MSSIQKVDHLKEHDLVLIGFGWRQCFHPAIFVKASKVSITYHILGSSRTGHIRTANSNYQRVYKITEDNLNELQLDFYKSYLIKVNLEKDKEAAKVQIVPLNLPVINEEKTFKIKMI